MYYSDTGLSTGSIQDNKDLYLLLQLHWLVNSFLSWLYKIELAECQTETENVLWKLFIVHSSVV